MKKAFAASLLALFTASCGDPNQPPRYLDVAPPEWTATLQMNVKKRSCYITTPTGDTLRIGRSATDIGNGLTATRSKRNCTVSDQYNVSCRWNQSERLKWCVTPNPAYAAYIGLKR